MSHKTKVLIKAALAGVLCAGAVAFGAWRLWSGVATGEEGLEIWFYDQSEQKLYGVGRDTIAPHEGIGGPKGDGVRAIVVAAETDCGDPGKQRIAYLETHTPELKELLEGVQTACAEGYAYAKPIPSGESDFFDKNTLVRRPGEPTWHDMTTPQAKRIVAEWRAWDSPEGSSLVVCTP